MTLETLENNGKQNISQNYETLIASTHILMVWIIFYVFWLFGLLEKSINPRRWIQDGSYLEIMTQLNCVIGIASIFQIIIIASSFSHFPYFGRSTLP